MAVDPTPPGPIPAWVAYVGAVVASIVALFAGQGLIDNGTEKFIAGLAAIVIPAVFMLANSLHLFGHAKVQAAQIEAKTAAVNAASASRR